MISQQTASNDIKQRTCKFKCKIKIGIFADIYATAVDYADKKVFSE
jgi:hypothetical protein